MRPATMEWVARDNRRYGDAKRKHDAEMRMVTVRVYPWHACCDGGGDDSGGAGAGGYSASRAKAEARVLKLDRRSRLRALVAEAWRALHGGEGAAGAGAGTSTDIAGGTEAGAAVPVPLSAVRLRWLDTLKGRA